MEPKPGGTKNNKDNICRILRLRTVGKIMVQFILKKGGGNVCSELKIVRLQIIEKYVAS